MNNTHVLTMAALAGMSQAPMMSYHQGSARWWTKRSSTRSRLYERRRKAKAKKLRG